MVATAGSGVGTARTGPPQLSAMVCVGSVTLSVFQLGTVPYRVVPCRSALHLTVPFCTTPYHTARRRTLYHTAQWLSLQPDPLWTSHRSAALRRLRREVGGVAHCPRLTSPYHLRRPDPEYQPAQSTARGDYGDKGLYCLYLWANVSGSLRIVRG